MSGSALPAEALHRIETWRGRGERIVFTNGVFDLVHPGHVEGLEESRLLGDRLVVGLNGDASVRRLKGASRPVFPERERVALLQALESVDLVVTFDEDTPERLIAEVRPDVLAKGGDWALERIVGREQVESGGGSVARIRVREGLSTTALIARIVRGG